MKRAFEAASRLPEDQQNELARYLLVLSQWATNATVSAEEAAAIAEAEAELARGERAPDDQVTEFWRRNGL